MRLKDTCALLVAVNCLAFFMASCGSHISIETSYDHSANFEKYHTFALNVAPAELAPLGRHTLEATLRARLSARGLQEVAADEANLLIVSKIDTEQTQIRSNEVGRVYVSPNFGRYSETTSVVPAPRVTQVTYGWLIIDFVDTASRKLVFRGIGKGRVNIEEKNASAIEAVASKVVAAIPKLGGR